MLASMLAQSLSKFTVSDQFKTQFSHENIDSQGRFETITQNQDGLVDIKILII